MNKLARNAEIAASEGIPICQDTGMAFVFARIGQEVHITGGLFADAVNAGVAAAYDKGFCANPSSRRRFAGRIREIILRP